MLLEPGVTITPDTIRMLERAGIGMAYMSEPGEDVGSFVHSARNTVMSIGELQDGQRATRPIFDSGGTLLAEAGTIFTERMTMSLRRRGIDRIYVRKTNAEMNIEQVQAFRRAYEGKGAVPPEAIRDQLDVTRFLKSADCSARSLDTMLENGSPLISTKSDEPFAAELRGHNAMEARQQSAKDGFMVLYEHAAAKTSSVFKVFGSDQAVDPEEIGNLTRGIIGGLIEDRELLINLHNVRSEPQYLAGHSLTVSILAITMATMRGYDRNLVLEMAYASYLHDIGMLRLPEGLVNKPGKLTHAEMLHIRRHPIHSLDMLQRLVSRAGGVPATVPIVAYQSHERENGSGYPKGRSGRVVHEFAKIVAVCDIYQALISKRPWRPAMLPYHAMEQIVLMGARRELDPDIVRALLSCVSLFPIGSWVELADGARARVVATSGSNYAKPVVSVTERRGEKLSPPSRLNLAEYKDVEIRRPIPPPETLGDPMEGF